MRAFFIVILMCITTSLIAAGGYRNDGLASPAPRSPKYVTNLMPPYPSSDWWTSVIIRQKSNLMQAFPLGYQVFNNTATKFGLGIVQKGSGTVAGNAVITSSDFDIDVYTTSMVPANVTAKLENFGDWSVTLNISDDATPKMKVTLVKGSPFCYFEINDTSPINMQMSFTVNKYFDDSGTQILSSGTYTADHIGMELKLNSATGQVTRWGIFCPPNTTFSNVDANNLRIRLGNSEHYMSVALLSSNSDLSSYYQHAYCFVTNTKVSWSYDDVLQKITSTFTAKVENKRTGFSNTPILGLFMHQWKNTSDNVGPQEYPSLRGIMKVFRGTEFSSENQFYGIIPSFTEPIYSSSYSQATQIRYLRSYSNALAGNFYENDTYWQGKKLSAIARALMIADQVGEMGLKSYFSNALYTVLTNWYIYTPGEPRYYFSYFNNNGGATNNWGTLVGYDPSYDSQNMNDQHFHYGYFIYASAILSMYNQKFITDYGNMVEQLIRNIDSPDHNDAMYPFLRFFDPYEGHSWADGVGDFGDGNDQESSSEAMNAWAGIYLWGLNSGNNTYRDLGAWGYTVESSAIRYYYYNQDNDVFPAAWTYKSVGILWGAKYDHATWFSADPECIFGIEWIPITPSSMYLGYNQTLAGNLYSDFTTENGGNENLDTWYDVIWKFEAFTDPQTVITKFSTLNKNGANSDPNMQDGSWADMYWFMHNMNSLGAPITTVRSVNSASYQVFLRNGTNTYVAYNPTAMTNDIIFANGGSCIGKLKVPPYTTVTSRTLESCIPVLDHFEIVHDGVATINQFESVTIKAIDNIGSVMTNWTGTMTLSVATGYTGIIAWSTNDSGNNGVFVDLGSGQATYNMTVADKGQVILRLIDDSVESIDPEVTDGSHYDTDVTPQYLVFQAPPLLDHFEIIHDGQGTVNNYESVEINLLSQYNTILTNWTGVLTLSIGNSYSGNVVWNTNASGNNGVFVDLGNGQATYNMTLADKGKVFLRVVDDTAESIDPEVTDGSHYDNDVAPQMITFKEPGTTIYVDKNNVAGPWDGTSWATAYKTITDALPDFANGSTNRILIATGIYKEQINLDATYSGSLSGTNVIAGFTNGVIIDAEHIRDYGFNFTGSGAGNVDYIRIENIIINGAKGSGISMVYGASNVIKRVVFNDCNGGNGWAIYMGASKDNKIENSTFISNTRAICLAGDAYNTDIRNCIIINNTEGINSPGGIGTVSDYNNVWNNGTDYLGISAGANSLSTNPLFLSYTYTDSDFAHLSGTSPCIDKGDPAYDSDPEMRGSHIDLGAFEFETPLTTSLSIYVNVKSVVLNGLPSKKVPGATMQIEVMYSNTGNTMANYAVIYQKISTNVVYDTNINGTSSGWAVQWSTNSMPNQSYSSPDYDSVRPNKENIKYVRWIKPAVNSTEDGLTLIYKVIIK